MARRSWEVLRRSSREVLEEVVGAPKEVLQEVVGGPEEILEGGPRWSR